MEKLEIKAEVSIDDAGTITGLAWPFGTADSVGDIIEKGAFALPPALPIVMEHDQKQVVGVWESYAETDAGLEVKGRLFVEGIGPAREARKLCVTVVLLVCPSASRPMASMRCPPAGASSTPSPSPKSLFVAVRSIRTRGLPL